MTFDLSLSESAASRSLDRLVGRFFDAGSSLRLCSLHFSLHLYSYPDGGS